MLYWEVLRKINNHNLNKINVKKVNVLVLDNLLTRKGNYKQCLIDLNDYVDSIKDDDIYLNVLGYLDGGHNNNYFLNFINDDDLLFSYFYNRPNQVLEKPLKVKNNKIEEEIKNKTDLSNINVNSIKLKEDSYVLCEEGLVRNDDVILIKNRKYKVSDVLNINGTVYLKLNKGLIKYDLNIMEVIN